MGRGVVTVESGFLMFTDEEVVVVEAGLPGEQWKWGFLQPLADYHATEEILVSEEGGKISVETTINGQVYSVRFEQQPEERELERLVQRIAIEAGIPRSDVYAEGSGMYDGWRVHITTVGGLRIIASRITDLGRINYHPLLMARLLALLMAPSTILFVGPLKSGKTAALAYTLTTFISVCRFPMPLKVAIVEDGAEIFALVKEMHLDVVPYLYHSREGVLWKSIDTALKFQPDLLVVGEFRLPRRTLSKEELFKEFTRRLEAACSGLPVLATVQGDNLTDAMGELDALGKLAGFEKAKLSQLVDVYVVCSGPRTVNRVRRRGISEVYVRQRGQDELHKVYDNGWFLPEEEFLNFLPPQLMFRFHDDEEAAETYGEIKRRLGVTT